MSSLSNDRTSAALRQINELQTQLTTNQSQSLDQVINHLNNTGQANREELAKTLAQSSEQMSKRIDSLTQATDNRLQEISGQVEKRLAEGFEKTTKTFSDILQRLALIDDAQKKISLLFGWCFHFYHYTMILLFLNGLQF